MVYIRADLHQRFCSVAVRDATGQVLEQRSVANRLRVLVGYIEQYRISDSMGKKPKTLDDVEVSIDAPCGPSG